MGFGAFYLDFLMDLSFWERNTWLSNIDFAIVGSGIVGLSCALALRKKYPGRKIVVFEKGMLPSGASTKNAGFACFGSLSEISEDLKTHTEEEVVALVQQRVDGLKLLRNTLGDGFIDYQEHGGYELFSLRDANLYHDCLAGLPEVNRLLRPVFESEVFSIRENEFGFQKIHKNLIYNQFEGQIDTGKMMQALLQKASEAGILLLNNAEITNFTEDHDAVHLQLNQSEEVSVKKLLIATNGFARQLLNEDVQPARAQVLITKPIENLNIKGAFHLDKGYYYFRNINDRILFGGGRNLDFQTEETTQAGLTPLIQETLEELLETTILPDQTFTIDTRWSGIMGVGARKKPIVKSLSNHVCCGVRLGGMGVAIGSNIGNELADLM